MCEKCDDIDERIGRLKYIAKHVLDQPTLDGIGQMVTELEAEKASLHPEEDG